METDVVHGYTNNSYPNVSDPNNYLTVSYYDDYSRTDGILSDTTYQYHRLGSSVELKEFSRVHGKPVASKVKVLDKNTWLKSVVFYDKHGRITEAIKENYPDGRDIVNLRYNFAGEILESYLQHTPDFSDFTVIRERYEYDHIGRLRARYHKINDQYEVLLTAISYNELGQAIEKNLHCEAYVRRQHHNTFFQPSIQWQHLLDEMVDQVFRQNSRLWV